MASMNALKAEYGFTTLNGTSSLPHAEKAPLMELVEVSKDQCGSRLSLGKPSQRIYKCGISTTSHQASKSLAEACRNIYGTVCTAVLPKDICPGLYVLVQLLCQSGKKITQYRYVGVCQSDLDEDGEIRVQFLTTIDGKRFTEIVNDISDVQFEDTIVKLEAPEKKTDGNNMFIEFSANIDVFEKK
ncbi:hypothetical protein TNCT_662231 [Trichonephila clavata]|uniref:Uncharacterized protein n=1 Tax=Trichonephila clavata TaxID=2740835 RepID=A0A8X6F8V6_TRICU|nr:hypothetical protein TNCT_662231 [Trichonephila clavata]